MGNVSIIGIDLAKNVFQIHGVDANGKKRLGKTVKRNSLLRFLAKQPSCVVAMEACCGAHFWAREIAKLGHKTKILHPQYVKPFVQGYKNDARDAQAITEAAARPSIPEVAQKTVEQLDLQALHRVRERLMKERTAIGNELRGLLAEMGIVIRTGHKVIREEIHFILEDASNGMSIMGRQIIQDLQNQWLEREERIAQYDKEIQQIAQENEICKRLQSIPGIGVINATLLYSHAGDASSFASGRHFSASVGLVPKQHSSGGKERLSSISKRGNKHVRKQLVHGARSTYKKLLKPEDQSHLGKWVKRMEGKHPNKIIVALANKLARIAWVLMKNETSYVVRA